MHKIEQGKKTNKPKSCYLFVSELITKESANVKDELKKDETNKENIPNIFKQAFIQKKDLKEEDDKKPESINIDSLLNAYKEEAVKPEIESDESKERDLAQNSPKKEVRWKVLPTIKFEKELDDHDDHENAVQDDENDIEMKEKKVRSLSLTIKSKHKESRDDRSSKILLPVMKVSNHNQSLSYSSSS